MRIKEQILTPILGNLPIFTLSWSLIAIIALAANDPNCRSLTMGHSEKIIQAALGLPWKNFIIWLMGFYLLAGILLSLSGRHGRLVEIQEVFLRPVAVPVLFQLAGLLGGLTAEAGVSYALLRAIAVAIALVAFALVVYSAAEVFRMDTGPRTGDA